MMDPLDISYSSTMRLTLVVLSEMSQQILNGLPKKFGKDIHVDIGDSLTSLLAESKGQILNASSSLVYF